MTFTDRDRAGWMAALAALGALSVLIGCGGGGSPEVSPSASPSPTPSEGDPLAAPGNLAGSLTGDTVRLTWLDRATRETGYEVQVNDAGLGWRTLSTFAANTIEVTYGGLEADTPYELRVRAVGSGGAAGAFSNIVRVATPPLPQTTFSPISPYRPNYTNLLTNKARWSTRAFTYSLDTTADGRDEAFLQAMVQRAMDRWTTASGGLFTFTRVSDPASAHIKVAFAPGTDPDIIATGESGSATFTFTTGAPRSTITSADVKIKAGLVDGVMLSVIAHEIGHAIGITAHSDVSSDLMFASFSSYHPVTERDVNTLAFLYLTDLAN